jgi:hypothetical protein
LVYHDIIVTAVIVKKEVEIDREADILHIIASKQDVLKWVRKIRCYFNKLDAIPMPLNPLMK